MSTMTKRLEALVERGLATREEDVTQQTFLTSDEPDGTQMERYTQRRGTMYLIPHPVDCEDSTGDEDDIPGWMVLVTPSGRGATLYCGGAESPFGRATDVRMMLDDLERGIEYHWHA